MFSVSSVSVRSVAVSSRSVTLIALSLVSMAHVGSPDTFFAGKAGPYEVRISVRLPGVIPGRAQVTVRVPAAAASSGHRVTVQAAQWNVGLKGAPPAETAAAVAGDPTLFSSELWFMTAQPYELSVAVHGPSGEGSVRVPVVAIATAQRPMTPWFGAILAALGVFLTVGMLTIIGAAMREGVLPPGVEPDARRRRSGRIGMALAGAIVAFMLWGGNAWWTAEASNYGRFVLYRPFSATAAVSGRTLTLGIRDNRWPGTPFPNSRFNALMPDHGKLMHMFLIGDGLPGVSDQPSTYRFAHVHPVARSSAAQDFDVAVPALPPGKYRIYADIVHESGYAQTLVTDVMIAPDQWGESKDPDDSVFVGEPVVETASAAFAFDTGEELVWQRGPELVAGRERDLKFFVRDRTGAALSVEPYMGMAAHIAIASRDGSVFAHLHPSGSVSMAALQRLAAPGAAAEHDGHVMPLDSAVAIPYAFPKAGPYRMWVQVKRGGRVHTGAFDLTVQ